MSLTPDRNRLPRIAALAACGLSLTFGCARKNYAVKTELNPTPIIEDEAMQQRQWALSRAMVPSGVVPAGPILFEYEPKRYQEEFHYYYADIGVFLGNTLRLPYQLFVTPPWREVYYSGEVFPPTFTAMPPTPPEIRNEPPLPAAATAEPTTRPGA